MSLPGLAEHEAKMKAASGQPVPEVSSGAQAEPVPEKPLTIEQKLEHVSDQLVAASARIKDLTAQLAGARSDATRWEAKFKSADAEVSRYQTQNAELAGKLGERAKVPQPSLN